MAQTLATVRERNQAIVYPGRRAVVIGGTAGIGHGIAVRLARANIDVTLVGRNEAAGETIIQEMRGIYAGNHDFIRCDGSLVQNAKDFANVYASKHPEGLDYLVITQGIATIQGFTPTSEGIDQKLAIHYYVRMAFINSLLPQMRNSPDPRVLSVLSGGVHRQYENYREDPTLKDHYTLPNAANAAGFYNDIGLDSFSREHPGVAFIHAAPGIVSTNWGTEMPWYIRCFIAVARPFLMSLYDCGEFMSDAILNPAWKGGYHVLTQTATEARPTQGHEEAREFVWAHTKEVIGRV